MLEKEGPGTQLRGLLKLIPRWFRRPDWDIGFKGWLHSPEGGSIEALLLYCGAVWTMDSLTQSGGILPEVPGLYQRQSALVGVRSWPEKDSVNCQEKTTVPHP